MTDDKIKALIQAHWPQDTACDLYGFARAIAAAEREEVAKICDQQMQTAEYQEAVAKSRAAHEAGDLDEELRALKHAANVGLYNAGPRNCADAIRAAIRAQAGK